MKDIVCRASKAHNQSINRLLNTSG